MTKEEILAMEAGGDLDALVAKEITEECYHTYWTEDGKDSIDCLKCGQSRFYHQHSQNYSTDISAAWQVVEKLRSMEDGEDNPLLCCLTIYSDHDLCWDIRWCYSELSNRNDGHETHRLPTCYDELPEAICKAALLAKLTFQRECLGKERCDTKESYQNL